MSQTAIDQLELLEEEENPSSAVYAMKQTLRSIQTLRQILEKHPERLGEEYELVKNELDEVEGCLEKAISACLVKANQEPPDIGMYDGVELGGGQNLLKKILKKLNIFDRSSA